MFKKGKIYKNHGGGRKGRGRPFFLEWGKALFDFFF